MCCFTVATPVGLVARWFARPVHVSGTTIFARMVEPGRQALAYAMRLEVRSELAMVLPLPVAPGSGEDALRFIDLSGDEDRALFEDLAELFVAPQPKSRSLVSRTQGLTVHRVGAFVASYVPARADFARLEPRFRLPEVLFDAVPHYVDHGFAVFQLERGDARIHPMAFTFPTRAPDRLFFPTVHVHDGRFHRRAAFDHALYYQATAPRDPVGFAHPARSYGGLVTTGAPVARRELRGKLANVDTWV
jgi:hypothetical protein